MTKTNQYLLFAIIFTIIALLPQLVYEYKIWNDPSASRLSDAILWTLYITLPAGILASGSFVLAVVSIVKQHRRK